MQSLNVRQTSLRAERTAGEHVGGKIRIRQHHPAQADEVGHAVAQRVLADVRQPLLEVGVGRTRRTTMSGNSDLSVAVALICRATPCSGSSGGS